MFSAHGLRRGIFLFIFIINLLWGTGIVLASDDPDGETILRQTSIVISYTRYEWWLLRWSDSQLMCQVFIDHESWPTSEEVLIDCGGDVYSQWVSTPPCGGLEDGSALPGDCLGLYLFYVG